MNTDDNINESIKKHFEIKPSADFVHLVEPILRAREEFRVSVEPYLGTFQRMSDSAITIGHKIEPLLRIQEQITDSASLISSVVQKIPTIDSDRLAYISDGAIQAGKSLRAIQDLTLRSSSLFSEANYDLLVNPISSALSIAVDNVALHQKTILGDLDSIAKMGTITSHKFNEWDSISLKISDVALGALEQSPYLFPDYLRATTIPVFKDPTTERIEKLEDEVKSLREKKEKDIIVEINHEVEKLLLSIDSFLPKMFKGAYAVVNQNDDSLAQSAESMTRLLENLPAHLVKNFKSQQKTKEAVIKETLAVHLSLEYTSVDDINHPLISQQHYFYETFSQIRHRNSIYKDFENDPARYKALLLQVEGFLYQLIKAK
ncbi:MAG: hypothetical protein KGZ39_02635 [Simkania sp.]|nr:hypothetical protein [Simkania sp.]